MEMLLEFHVIHIKATTFTNTTFGKIKSPLGLKLNMKNETTGNYIKHY